jgi:peptide/nickel transport system permease protein
VRHYLLRRAIEYGLTLFLAISLNFFLPHAMPGDPLALIAGDAVRQMGAERIAELRHAYGLDRPIGEQYLLYLGRLASGELGQSYRFSGGRSVAKILTDRLKWTFFLVFVSLSLATWIGSGLGAWAAWRRGQSTDLGLLTLLFTLRSMPAFWLAMIFISIFSVGLRLFPSGDSYSIPRPAGFSAILDVLRHAVLPIAVLTLTYMPTPFAIMRSSMLGVLGGDYIRTARAKGLPETQVLFRHAMRNALLPVVTAFALDFGQLLGGVTLIETVFNYRGIGSMMFEAVKSRDYPLLQGGFLVFTIGVLTINLVTDGLYSLLDPRLKARRA